MIKRVMDEVAFSIKEKLIGRSIYLVGMMGCGKSSCGRPLAAKLKYGFIDSDSVIEEVTKCTISEFFHSHGEADFRKIETKVLNEISKQHSLVVATGGGIVTKPENWGIMHQGIVIWLDVDRDILIKRLQKDFAKRPLLQEDEIPELIDTLLNTRISFYSESDLIIKLKDESPLNITNKIITHLPKIFRDEI